jgi:IS30 family transposase
MKKYKQLTYEQRCQIYALKKTKISQQEVADSLGVHPSIISREFNRNIDAKSYRFGQEQSKKSPKKRGEGHQNDVCNDCFSGIKAVK